MITFVNAQKDSYDPVRASISIAYSDSMRDGDLLIAAIAEPRGDLAVIMPPAGWTRLRNVRALTAANDGVGLTVYYRFAENEPARWTWAFAGQPAAFFSGVVAAYRGVDYHVPIDVVAGRTSTSAGVTATSPESTTADANEQIIAVYATNKSTAFASTAVTVRESRVSSTDPTLTTGFASVAIGDVLQAAAGVTGGYDATLAAGSPGVWASILIALRPDTTTVSADETKRNLQALFPPGTEDLWDWDSSASNVYKKTLADAEFVKRFGYDLRDLVEREAVPNHSILKLPDWESALGISEAVRSRRGADSTARRHALVTEKFRESGTPTKAKIRAVLEPLLKYDTGGYSGTLAIIETNRYKLREAHTYRDGTSVTVGVGGNTSKTIAVADDGYVSAAGAQVDIQISAANPEELVFTLSGPTAGSGTVQTGTISTRNAETLVEGQSTRFTVLAPGMQITGDGGGTWHTIDSIQNDTLLTLTLAAGQVLTAQAYSSRRGQATTTWNAATLPVGSTTREWFRLSSMTPMAQRTIFGNWTFTMTAGATAGASIHHVRLFVEGSGRDSVGNDGLGTAIHYCGVVVEEGKIPATHSVDWVAFGKAVDRLTHAHAVGFYVRIPTTIPLYGYGAIPSATVTSPYAVPGLCIPSLGAFIPWGLNDTASDVAVAARNANEGRSRKHPATDGYFSYVRLP